MTIQKLENKSYWNGDAKHFGKDPCEFGDKINEIIDLLNANSEKAEKAHISLTKAIQLLEDDRK